MRRPSHLYSIQQCKCLPITLAKQEENNPSLKKVVSVKNVVVMNEQHMRRYETARLPAGVAMSERL